MFGGESFSAVVTEIIDDENLLLLDVDWDTGRLHSGLVFPARSGLIEFVCNSAEATAGAIHTEDIRQPVLV
jgi:hypothetical protein